jgi:hypothetical protein
MMPPRFPLAGAEMAAEPVLMQFLNVLSSAEVNPRRRFTASIAT